jgi:hypothetical protein
MLTGLVIAAVAAVAQPATLAVPPAATLIFRAEARGVQLYVCRAGVDKTGGYDWTFKEPRADLYDQQGRVVGRHYAGPSWEGADGGKVVGQLLAKAPSPDPSAIDWLLLSAMSTNGIGVLGKTAYVQRLRTRGGRAPLGGCSQTNSGAQTSIPYTAEYEFYSAP